MATSPVNQPDNRVPRFGFPKRCRLCKSNEFQRVYRDGVHAADHMLVVQGCRNGSTESRLGLAVSRRVGNAVVRNRWKRLIREAFRLQRSRLPRGLDLVVRPRRGAEPSFQAIQRSLVRLARRVQKRLEDH